MSDREESIYRWRDEELEPQRREREAEVQRGREREGGKPRHNKKKRETKRRRASEAPC